MGARRWYVTFSNRIDIKSYLETGHFERRISFGYDADLSQVRAEFNGEMLLVIVPRRAPVLTWYGEACE